MTYTISYIRSDNRYGVHIGVGTMYNMSNDYSTYEKALAAATALATAYKTCFPSEKVKVVMDNGIFNPTTDLIVF